MDTLLQDLRYSLRRLSKSPAFAAIVVLTLALGIGANTAIFSAVNAILLRPLPYPEPGELVTIEHLYPSLDGLEAPVSVPGFLDYQRLGRSFESMAVQSGWAANLTGVGDPERLPGARVTGRFFTTLQVPALIGRTLQPGEDAAGREHVVVLSYGVWQRLFEGGEARLDLVDLESPAGDVDRLEAIAGDVEHDALVGSYVAPLRELGQHGRRHPTGGLGEDPGRLGQQPHPGADLVVGDRVHCTARAPRQLDRVGAVGRIADGQRLGDRVGPHRTADVMARLEGLGHG